MSGEKDVQNNDVSPEVDDIQNGPAEVQKKPGKFALFLKSLVSPPKRLSNIDWSKKTAKNLYHKMNLMERGVRQLLS